MIPVIPILIALISLTGLLLLLAYHQRKEIKKKDKHIAYLMDDNVNDFAKYLRARTEAETWKRHAYEANMVLAALYQYPDDKESELEVDETDPRNGAGTVH